MAHNALRGLGPRTFISYSFRDMALADAIGDFLKFAGFQVTMENETSLLNAKLAEILPRRIESAECFVVRDVLLGLSRHEEWEAEVRSVHGSAFWPGCSPSNSSQRSTTGDKHRKAPAPMLR